MFPVSDFAAFAGLCLSSALSTAAITKVLAERGITINIAHVEAAGLKCYEGNPPNIQR